MAKLISTVPVTVVKIESVTLELTGEEANALRKVCACVSGLPQTSRRGLIDEISNALTEAMGPYIAEPYDTTGGITFR